MPYIYLSWNRQLHWACSLEEIKFTVSTLSVYLMNSEKAFINLYFILNCFVVQTVCFFPQNGNINVIKTFLTMIWCSSNIPEQDCNIPLQFQSGDYLNGFMSFQKLSLHHVYALNIHLLKLLVLILVYFYCSVSS